MTTEITPFTSNGVVTVDADFKHAKAHEKRLGGFTWRAVADEFGYSSEEDARQSVRAYLQRAVAQISKRTRQESLDRELDRLEILQSACWDMALSGDLKAIETSLKIISQRSKLMGLEQLSESAVTHQTILVSGTKDQFVDTLKSISKGA